MLAHGPGTVRFYEYSVELLRKWHECFRALDQTTLEFYAGSLNFASGERRVWEGLGGEGGRSIDISKTTLLGES